MSSVNRVRMMVSKWASHERAFSASPHVAAGHRAHNVGVLAMETYIPSRFVSQSELEKADNISAGKYTVGEYLVVLLMLWNRQEFCCTNCVARRSRTTPHGICR